ncbi:MAG: hypothetical protein R2788_14980 [Saprospiraceae bacterium]
MDCFDSSVQLNGGGSTLGPDITYEWTTINGQIISGGNTLQPTVFAAGAYYYLTVTNAVTGCQVVDSVYVEMAEYLYIYIDNPLIIFCESPLELTVNVVTSVSNVGANWTTSDGHIVSGEDELVVTIDQAGTYCVNVYDVLTGCFAMTCATIQGYQGNATDVLAVAEAGPDKFIDCSGDPVELDGTGSSTTQADYSYAWTAQNCCIQSGANTLFPTVNTQGWYYLTVTNNDTGCSATDSVYVNGLEVVIDPASFLCNLSEITLHAEVTGNTLGATGFWTTLDGNIVSGADTNDPIINAPGRYCFEIISVGQYCMVEECIDVELDQSSCSVLEGYVLVDGNGNCLTDTGEMPLSGWLVTATGSNGTFYGTTDTNGFYSIPVEPGVYTVNLTVASNVYSVCDNDIDVTLSSNGSTILLDFSVAESLPCPILSVDLSNNILRRCDDGNFFHVKYCNEGTETATAVYIEVTLDPDLTFVYSSIGSATTHVGGQVYSFAVGDIDPDECGQFWFQAFLDCDVEIAETHCTEAHIFPDDDCFPANPLWSGASLEVRASCSDSTRFTITNVGTAALTVPAGYLVIEDAVMYRPGEVGLLAPGESMVVALPANGSTWRLELEQEPFHPFPNVPVAWVEGCGDNVAGSFSQGFVNQRFLGDRVHRHRLHRQSSLSTPTTNRGSPLGHSAEHFVQKENQIEYLIRFQNTGNDTARTNTPSRHLGCKLDLDHFAAQRSQSFL